MLKVYPISQQKIFEKRKKNVKQILIHLQINKFHSVLLTEIVYIFFIRMIKFLGKNKE